MKQREVRKSLFKPFWNTSLGAPANEIEELIWANNNLWVGSSAGVNCLINGTRETVAVKPLKGRKNVSGYSGIYNPVTKTLWFASTNGLEEIDPKSKTVIRIITKDEGLLSSESNWLEAVNVDNTGAVYMGHPSGITIYQPLLDEKNATEPPVRIRKANFTQSVWGDNIFSVEYAALSFGNEKLVRYKTRLVGYENDWSKETTENKTRYTNLSAFFFNKEYTFEISACNNSGVWTKTPVSYSIIVVPAIWFRWWAFFFYALGVYGLARGYKWGEKNLRIIIESRKSRYVSHYRLHEILGEGGMGKVYKAIDKHESKTVAIKILSPHLLKDEENRRRLASEGRLLSSLNHPNIVKVLEFGETAEHSFVAMEYLSGGTLHEFIEKNYPLSEEKVIEITKQICSGLQTIHSHDIIHRDLKSQNIMFDEAGKVRIMDFGLSKSPLVSTMTTLGTVVGTLGFVAPEQVTNINVDHRVDIFSLGVVLYQMLTNKLPFSGENEIALIHSIFNTVPPCPSEINSIVTPKLEEVVKKCLEKNVDRRFQTVKEIMESLG